MIPPLIKPYILSALPPIERNSSPTLPVQWFIRPKEASKLLHHVHHPLIQKPIRPRGWIARWYPTLLQGGGWMKKRSFRRSTSWGGIRSTVRVSLLSALISRRAWFNRWFIPPCYFLLATSRSLSLKSLWRVTEWSILSSIAWWRIQNLLIHPLSRMKYSEKRLSQLGYRSIRTG